MQDWKLCFMCLHYGLNFVWNKQKPQFCRSPARWLWSNLWVSEKTSFSNSKSERGTFWMSPFSLVHDTAYTFLKSNKQIIKKNSCNALHGSEWGPGHLSEFTSHNSPPCCGHSSRFAPRVPSVTPETLLSSEPLHFFSLCLECSSLRSHMLCSFTSFRSLLQRHLLCKAFPKTLRLESQCPSPCPPSSLHPPSLHFPTALVTIGRRYNYLLLYWPSPSHPIESKHHRGREFCLLFFSTALSPGTIAVPGMEQMLTKYLLKGRLSHRHRTLRSLTQPPETHVWKA